ncbi:MAG TPA: hypothetical protein PK243_09295, partial [Flexilinea sp.]|nr:hypothetical protein [Flexilinea sp.]
RRPRRPVLLGFRILFAISIAYDLFPALFIIEMAYYPLPALSHWARVFCGSIGGSISGVENC